MAAFVAGLATTILLGSIWLVVSPPLYVALPLVVLSGLTSVVASAIALGWWDWAAAPLRKRRRRHRIEAIREQQTAALASVSQLAATEVSALLLRHGHPNPIGRLGTRKLLRDYERSSRETARDALQRARATCSVPGEVARCVEEPRSVAEVERLRDWLRSMAEVS